MAWISANISMAATPVYRTLGSRYDSGHAYLPQLQEKIERVTPQIWQQIYWQKKLYWVPAEQLLSSIHFTDNAVLAKATKSYSQPNLHLAAKRTLPAFQLLQIKKLEGAWAQVAHLHLRGRSHWLESRHLTARHSRYGQVYTLDRAILYQQASLKSKIMTLLNPNTRLQIVGFSGNWLQVRFGRLRAFILPEQVLGVWQLADKIKFQGKWQQVNTWRGRHFLLPGGSALSLAVIEDFWSSQRRLLVGPLGAELRAEPKIQSPVLQEVPAGHSVNLHQSRRTLWAHSSVPHIGKVWWKMEKNPATAQPKKTLPASRFFQRRLYDMVRISKNKSTLFASAKGIFRSDDGLHWHRIEQFKDHDFPLATTTSGQLFVGPYRSDDSGKTFSPYIRWDQFLKKLQKRVPHDRGIGLDQIKISKIAPLDSSGKKIRLTIKVGKKAVTATTTDSGKSWRLQ